MNVAARVCRSPDSWPWTDHAQISLIHSPTPPKCSTRAIVALINNLGIVYHQYCSSSSTGLHDPLETHQSFPSIGLFGYGGNGQLLRSPPGSQIYLRHCPHALRRHCPIKLLRGTMPSGSRPPLVCRNELSDLWNCLLIQDANQHA
jgi:hypothetical protein